MKTRSPEIESIVVRREERQRRSLTEISSLAESMKAVGQLQPIILTEVYGDSEPELLLIAGERRLEAAKQLGWKRIAATLQSDLTDGDRKVIELEENVRREDLSWQDECVAIYNYHATQLTLNQDWTPDKSAAALLISRTGFDQKLIVAQELRTNPRVAKCPNYSAARKMALRARQRTIQSTADDADIAAADVAAVEVTLTDVPTIGQPPVPTPAAQTLPGSGPIYLADFNKWVDDTPTLPLKFNFIHCDFPYGTDSVKDTTQNTGVTAHGGYDNTRKTYNDLFASLIKLCNSSIVAEHAHILFWFDIRMYAFTAMELKRAGWTVIPQPLIWAKGVGILSDPRRRPRHVYETAFFGYRGDRPLVQAKDNLIAAPPDAAFKTHASEKPIDVLQHFFSMIVDSTTVMLDPTCGSGNAVNIALALGARSAMGLEIDEEFHAAAVAKFKETEEWRKGMTQ